MTRLTLTLALLGAISIIPASAFAMEPYLPRTTKSFGKLDADSNGKITPAELTPKAEKRFERLDTDRNGEVTAAEIDAAFKAALEKRRDRLMTNLDADRNGSISRAELDAAVDKLLAAADADHDGGVTLDEAKKYRVAKTAKPATGDSVN